MVLSVDLTLPLTELRRVLPMLMHRQEGLLAWGPLWSRAASGGTELLAPRLQIQTGGQARHQGSALVVRWAEPEGSLAEEAPGSLLGNASAVLEMTPTGAARGWWRDPGGRIWPLRSLFLPGGGMHRLPLEASMPPARERAAVRWSRLAGALGEDTLLRLHRLRVAVVGVGRNGSLMASSLARLGLRRLTLVDPDRIEPHNLDAMDGVTLADLGRPKVEAVGQALGEGLDLRLVAMPITRRGALRAVAEADLLVSCVDHDGARLAVGTVAAAYLRPLLDIGTGVFRQGRERQLGADLRLILPGESRCLACFGGVTRRLEVEALLRPDEQTPPLWSELRSGSLRSLNAVAVHFGLRLLEDLVDERVSESLWLRLEYEGALPGIRRITPTPVADCPLCRRLGWGDAIEAELPGLLATLAARMGGEAQSAPRNRDGARR